MSQALPHNHHGGTASLADARHCLMLSDPAQKCAAVEQLWLRIDNAGLDLELPAGEALPLQPGRPQRPELVSPAEVPRRRLGSVEGRAALLHAVAHIEFNAINLALDAACRFRGLPDQYYLDWLSVAWDETRHFRMLCERLAALGHAYGDLPAHDGLWQMAQATAEDVMQRMALVPRVLEARGLDVTPGMIERLRSVGDEESVAVLGVILEEEVRHVEIGTRWFRYCCKRRGVDPDVTFAQLVRRHYAGQLRGPFNLDARSAAGFSGAEMRRLGMLETER